MTRDKHTKRQIRSIMRVTGERYTTVRGRLFAPSSNLGRGVDERTAMADHVFTDNDLDQLRSEGFLVTAGLLTDRQVGELADVVAGEVAAAEHQVQSVAASLAPDERGRINVWAVEQGVHHLRFDAGDARFRPATRHRELLEFARRLFDRAVAVTEVAVRAATPGFGYQGLHQDLAGTSTTDMAGCLTVTFALSALTTETGATRVVPRSHRTGPRVPDEDAWGWAMAPHPEELRVVVPPGGALLRDPHLWHSETFNASATVPLSIEATLEAAV